jgi:hypothetical protein
MKGTQNSVLIALGITLLFTSGCYKKVLLEHGPGAGHHYGQQDQRVFEVYIYADPNNPGTCLSDWPVGTLWRNKHHTVTWFSDDGAEYTIDFGQGSHAPDKSPFQNGATFTVPGGAQQSSGALQPNATGYYDFAIRAGDANGPVCKQPSDPGYYVK